MEPSNACIDLIKQFEGCRLTAYPDIGGVLTIGYGHTTHVLPESTITQEQADQLLQQDMEMTVHALNAVLASCAKPLNQNQFDALVSFAYNVRGWASSTLIRMVKCGDFEDAADQFLLWDHVGSKVVEGLLRRRQAERSLFMSAV